MGYHLFSNQIYSKSGLAHLAAYLMYNGYPASVILSANFE